MPKFDFKGRKIFYESQGEGKPILILNGIMMSTKSWDPFVETLSERNQLIRVDFLDQGQSDRLENSLYTQELQVEIVEALLKHLNLKKVNLVGISYGGEIAMQVAIKYPHVVERLLLFNTTAYTSPWLAEIGNKWIEIGDMRNGSAYYKATIPVIYSPKFYESRLDWMKKREAILLPVFSDPKFLDAMKRLTRSAEKLDVRSRLSEINVPTLIVSADEDYLTPMANQRVLHEGIKNSELIILPGVGHASMYERPLLFTSLVLGFVQVKETTYTV